MLKKFRVKRHFQPESFPNCWLIQERWIWSNSWKFRVGFFYSESDANEFLKADYFKSLTGVIDAPITADGTKLKL